MERFIGNIDAKADAKGRISVPAVFRKILHSAGEMRLIMRNDVYQDCLVLHPAHKWQDELADLRSRLNKWDDKEQNIFRTFQYNVEELEMDAIGRILIPKRYLQMVNIKSEVRFIGVDYTIEIWNKDNLKKTVLNPDDFRKSVKEVLGSKQ